MTGFLREGERVVGVVAEDLETGQEVHVRAKQVINATGVWTDDTQEMVGGRGQLTVRASKGMHLVVPKDRIQSTTGMIVRTEKSVLFVIPWGRHWIIGTTDTDWELDKAHPAASSRDIQYLLDHVNALLERPLSHEDVEGVYAGLRPLLSGESDSTSKLSREHVVAHPVPGLVVVAGGKYTTYRVMAKDAVDEAVRSHAVPGAGVVHRGHPHGRRRRAGRRRGTAASAPPSAPACTSPASSTCCAATARDVDDVVALVATDPSLGEPLPGRRGPRPRRGGLRLLPRGRPPPGGRARPPDPDLHRDLRPRGRAPPARRRS